MDKSKDTYNAYVLRHKNEGEGEPLTYEDWLESYEPTTLTPEQKEFIRIRARYMLLEDNVGFNKIIEWIIDYVEGNAS